MKILILMFLAIASAVFSADAVKPPAPPIEDTATTEEPIRRGAELPRQSGSRSKTKAEKKETLREKLLDLGESERKSLIKTCESRIKTERSAKRVEMFKDALEVLKKSRGKYLLSFDKDLPVIGLLREPVKVFQVIDEHNFLGKIDDSNEIFWFTLNHHGLVDSDAFAGGRIVFKKVGAKQYRNAIGTSKTVHHLVGVSDAILDAVHEAEE